MTGGPTGSRTGSAPHLEERGFVAAACRILESRGHEHGFLGHVSARTPERERMVMKPAGLGLGEVGAEDIVEADLDGNCHTPGGRLHSEVPIHTEIYRVRPDVRAVVHTHPPLAAGLLASDARFAQVNQDSTLFVDRLAWLDDPRLIDTKQRGETLAAALGGGPVLLIRNHGIVTVGSSVEEAVFYAVALVDSIRIQQHASAFGALREIDVDTAREMAAGFADGIERRIASAWAYFGRQAGLGPRPEQEVGA